MSTLLHSNYAEINAKHKSSMLASLEHRLQVARAAHNVQLVEQLEQERKTSIKSENVRSKVVRSPFASRLNLWQSFTNLFTNKAELQVNQISDQQGNVWWYAYNPRTGQQVYADTDSEMLTWIEKNYSGL